MSIRSRILAIAGVAIITAALGGIAKADDQAPAGGAGPDGGQKAGANAGPAGMENPGQGGGAALDHDLRMMRGEQMTGGHPLDPHAAGVMNPPGADPTRSTPMSNGNYGN